MSLHMARSPRNLPPVETAHVLRALVFWPYYRLCLFLFGHCGLADVSEEFWYRFALYLSLQIWTALCEVVIVFLAQYLKNQ